MKIFSTLKKQATDFINNYKKKSPASFAAAKQAVGGLLILDGLVGIDNPISGKKRAGIFGTFISIIFGVVFIVLSFVMVGNTADLTSTTEGSIVDVSVNDQAPVLEGEVQTCHATAAYEIDGIEYQALSSFASSSQCELSVGQSVSINYSASQPEIWGYQPGESMLVSKLFLIIGVAVSLLGVLMFAVRLVSIIFGIKLLVDGRKLASQLPKGASIKTVVGEMKRDFAKFAFKTKK